MEKKERKYQLEQIGLGLIRDWHRQMAHDQPLYLSSKSMLSDALPQYRKWLGDIWQTRQNWIGFIEENQTFSEGIMPWHWLDMAGRADANENPKSSNQMIGGQNKPFLSRSPSGDTENERKADFKHLPSPDQKKSARTKRISKSEESEKYSHLAPTLKGNKAREEKQNARSNSEEVSRDFSKANSEAPKTNFSEPPKQIVFRGLNQFASFIDHNQVPPEVKPQPKSELEQSTKSNDLQNSTGKDREIQPKSFENVGQELPGFQSPSNPALKELELRELKAQIAKNLPKESVSSHFESNPVQNTEGSPRKIKGVNTIEKAENQAFWNWQEMQGKWEQKKQLLKPGKSPRKVDKVPLELNSPPKIRNTSSPSHSQKTAKRNPLELSKNESERKKTNKPSNQDPSGSEVAPYEFHSEESVRSKPEFRMKQYSRMENPGLKNQDNQIGVEDFMDEFTDQLKREFKRYYGG